MVNPSFQHFPASPYSGQMPVSPQMPGLLNQGMPGYNYPYPGPSMGSSSISPSPYGGNPPYIMSQKPPVQSQMGSMTGGMGSGGGLTTHPSTNMPYPTGPVASYGHPNTGSTMPPAHGGHYTGYPGMSYPGIGSSSTGMGTSGMDSSSSGWGTPPTGVPGISPSSMPTSYGTGMIPTSSIDTSQSGLPYMTNLQTALMHPIGSAYGNYGLVGRAIPSEENVPYPRSTGGSSQVKARTWSGNEKHSVPLYSTPIDPEAYGFPNEDGFRWHIPSSEIIIDYNN